MSHETAPPFSGSFTTTRQTAEALFRLRHLEFVLSRAAAGWAVSFHSVAQICELAQIAQEDMEACERLHVRLAEIPSGGWRGRKPEGAFARLLSQLPTAPSACAFWIGLFDVAKPELLKAYAAHYARTHTIMDTATVEAVCANRARLQAQLERNQVATDHLLREHAGDAETFAWSGHLRALIDAASGMLGLDAALEYAGVDYPPHEAAREMKLEARQVQRWHFEEHPPLPSGQDSNYFLNTEIAAVPMLGRLLFAADGMPWEFYFDTARHMWDEVRHFKMGRARLIELGLDPSAYAIPVGHYNAHATLTPLESYCQLVLVGEANSFEYKLRWKADCLKLGDEKSSAQQDFDIVDEQRHVAYGKKWIPVLKELVKDPRPIEQIVAEADVRVHAAKIAGMRAAGEPVSEELARGQSAADLIRRIGGAAQLAAVETDLAGA